MDTVIAILFEVGILVYAGKNLGRATSTLWRTRGAIRARRRGEPVRVPDDDSRQATIACVWTMATLVVLSTVTVLYLVIGKTPVDFLNDVGLHLPLSANRRMLLWATGAQALLKLYMTDKYGRSVDCHYFPADPHHTRCTDPDVEPASDDVEATGAALRSSEGDRRREAKA